MPIRENLSAVLAGIVAARQQPLAGHPLAQQVTHDFRDAVEAVVADSSYKVEGSAGKGHWAHTVWLSIFDRIITESARKGFYVVYLISGDGGYGVLSLNQATEEIYEEVGGRRYRKVLEDTATRDLGLLKAEDWAGLHVGPIDLGGQSRLTLGYEAGNILAVEYSLADLPAEDVLEMDLTRMLLLYKTLAEARGQVQDDESPADPLNPPLTETESKRSRWHQRAERSRGLVKRAKQIHGTRCQVAACGKELIEIYGDLAEGYIEAHHLTPFSQLKGRPTELDPNADFAVVCPDCHRMIHRRGEPYTLEEISARIENAAS